MYIESRRISSPVLLPLLGSILCTSMIAFLFISTPTHPTLNIKQIFIRAAMDLAIAASIHLATVWSIWRLTRDYLDAPVRLIMLHAWAAVVWIPLIALLSAEHSLWLCCIVPWSCANAAVFLKLWSGVADPDEYENQMIPASRILFHHDPLPPLWRALLPYVLVGIALQAGIALLAGGDAWMAGAFISVGVLILLLRHPLVVSERLWKQRRRFSKSSFVQTAIVFFLIAMTLTPFLQRAYAMLSLTPLLAMQPTEAPPSLAQIPKTGFSGVILTRPLKPHPRIDPPLPKKDLMFSPALSKPIRIPFDGAYWYFKNPDTRPRPDARVQRGDPIKANVRSTDKSTLIMEAHQNLPNSIAMNCCHGILVDLMNGDARPGIIRLEVRLKDTSAKGKAPISLGQLVIPSSALRHIPLTRPPIHESLRFALPPTVRGNHFNEITIVIAPDRDRSLAGSKIAIQQFTLLP